MREEALVIIIVFVSVAALFVGVFWFLLHNEDKEKPVMKTENAGQQNVREPAVAGSFYPSDAGQLAKTVDDFLAKANWQKPAGKILGLLVPHAGYDYSGFVAAAGFKQLEGAAIETVILIGNSHSALFEGAAVYDKGYFKMPLGEVAIDEELAQKIIGEDKKIKADMTVHAAEHSLEVEIPFLQLTLKNFKLVPILLGNGTMADVKILAKAIGKNIAGKNVLVVASTDMSHYPSYKDANYADKKTYEAILSGSVGQLEKTILQLTSENISNAQTFLCGKDAAETLMLFMQDLGAGDIKLLRYANSGDATGDKFQVVGYSAIGFYGSQRGLALDEQEQRRLLDIARQAVESVVKTGQLSSIAETDPDLNQKYGTFVTLKKDGELRGCIGRFSDVQAPPLWQGVAQMAVAAATQDPRFSPVGAGELSDLAYEVSVLGPMEKIDDWRKIELGKHGVQIKKDGRSGVFLPQVATETGWDLETFMGQLCLQKAGLTQNCWRDKDAEIYVFTAQVFGEEK